MRAVNRRACPGPHGIGEAVLSPVERPETLRYLEECHSCQQEALMLIRFLAEPDPGPGLP